MVSRESACKGCLLGMAVGDAMGYTVDAKTWQEICEDYGPNGLMGYDLVNGCAEVSSYTQLGAYAVNGLLLGITRGRPDLYGKFIQLSMKEWARKQDLPRDPERYYCWVAQVPVLRRRHCRDGRMLDTLRGRTMGSPEEPINKNANPGSLPAAMMAGLAIDLKRMLPIQMMDLGAVAVATTHGDEETFLSGAVLAGVLAGILADPKKSLKDQFEEAIEKMETRFGQRFSQAAPLASKLKLALHMSVADAQQTMESLVCDTAAQCVAGAMYACLASGGDFDSAMITAVNHSGRSAAVGAVTGAILGAWLGAEALPEFYLEGLEVVEVLQDLAKDLVLGSPTTGLFDDDWDQKYTQGRPVGQYP